MPRRPPKAVRAGLRRRTQQPDSTSFIQGLSGRALRDIARLERTRGYLWPGRTERALYMWQHFVSLPYHRLWVDNEGGCGVWECCGEPREARDILEGVMLALPSRSSAELRMFVREFDDLY
jgi:hypothetical protein